MGSLHIAALAGRLPAPFRQGPRSVRVGLALFAVGVLFVFATVIPFFFGDRNRSLWLNLGCMLAPLGFVLAITGTVHDTRKRQSRTLKPTDHTN